MGIPKAFASFDRAITQPSLLESTMTGLSTIEGLKTLSQDTKKLLQSTRANTCRYKKLISVTETISNIVL